MIHACGLYTDRVATCNGEMTRVVEPGKHGAEGTEVSRGMRRCISMVAGALDSFTGLAVTPRLGGMLSVGNPEGRRHLTVQRAAGPKRAARCFS